MEKTNNNTIVMRNSRNVSLSEMEYSYISKTYDIIKWLVILMENYSYSCACDENGTYLFSKEDLRLLNDLLSKVKDIKKIGL